MKWKVQKKETTEEEKQERAGEATPLSTPSFHMMTPIKRKYLEVQLCVFFFLKWKVWKDTAEGEEKV